MTRRPVLSFIKATYRTGLVYRTGDVVKSCGCSRAVAREWLRALTAEGSLYEFRPGYFRVTEFGPLAEGKYDGN